MAVLRGFFRWMVRENALLANPAADLIMPRAEKRLPVPCSPPSKPTR